MFSCEFIKRETPTQMFSCKFCEIFKHTFFNRTPPVATSVTYFCYLAWQTLHFASMDCKILSPGKSHLVGVNFNTNNLINYRTNACSKSRLLSPRKGCLDRFLTFIYSGSGSFIYSTFAKFSEKLSFFTP